MMKEDKLKEIDSIIKNIYCARDCNICRIFSGGCKYLNSKSREITLKIVEIMERKEK